MRVVLDANVLASALMRADGPSGQIVRALLDRQAFGIVLSAAILTETRRTLLYRRVQRRHGLGEPEVDRWLALVAVGAVRVADVPLVGAGSRDPDDDIYLSAAVEGLAAALVTGDQDLLVLRAFRGIPILTPRDFLARL